MRKFLCAVGVTLLLVAGVPGQALASPVKPTIACGWNHTVAIRDDGSVWAWGLNQYGQLGTGSTVDSHVPSPVNGPNGFGYLGGAKSAAAGFGFTMILKEDGTVWTLGDNRRGQLGTGSALLSMIYPVQVANLSGVIAVAAGYSHALALKSDGTVWAWGDNTQGQLGSNSTVGFSNVPVQVKYRTKYFGTDLAISNLNGVKAIASGMNHNLALRADNTVVAWGSNAYGQLAIGNAGGYVNYGVRVLAAESIPLQNITAISCGIDHSLALCDTGNVVAWGRNRFGQLGNNSRADSHFPVMVRGLYGSNVLNDIIAIASYGSASYAVDNSGKAWAWGSGMYAQLGIGSTTDSLAPVNPSFPKNLPVHKFTSIAAGASFAAMIRSDGKLYMWGYNGYGQLGNKTVATAFVPEEVPNFSLFPVVPAAPGGLRKGSYTDFSFTRPLLWNESPAAFGYHIHRISRNCWGRGWIDERVWTTTETSFTDDLYLKWVCDIDSLWYYVKAFNSAGESPPSQELFYWVRMY